MVVELPTGLNAPDEARRKMARIFGLLLERFVRGDGEPWRAVEIEAATGGEVTSSYVSALRKGKFKRPGIRQLELISEVMGFPFELWRVEPELWDSILGGHPPDPPEEYLELDEQERTVLGYLRRLGPAHKAAVVGVAHQLLRCEASVGETE